ncbi:serine hydrolase [Nakamurella sp. YIM 132087]|uniref:Serine hydrolase n=1 Tax=Nakamurella alba TaxID=2665158 RepID=A0A7K1FVT6_9ACTN|nr:serine hydrolase [Nakamurella alba]
MDLRAEIARWPVGSAAVAVLGVDGVLDRAATGADGQVYPWASVTKILTALTVLDACADGTVELDSPAGPVGSTVRHLLGHASGLPFDGPEPAAAPGSRRIYSNTGYEVLADHLADAAGGPFRDELTGRVLDRLGMTGTVLDGSPARDGAGPLEDLVVLAWELLAPRVLGPEIVGPATTLVFPGLSGVLPGFGRQVHNDWGLGCEIRADKSPHWTSPDNSPRTFGHFGQSGSFVWVDPDARLACIGLCDTPFGPWAAQAWPELSTAVLRAFS